MGLSQGWLSRDIEVALFRVAHEALTNVRKHAGATTVAMLVERRGDQMTLVVEDNGRGFAADSLPPARERAQLGLLGMRERVARLGGTLEIEATPGKRGCFCDLVTPTASGAHRAGGAR